MPIAKGKKSNVPLYIDDAAVTAPISEEKADKFVSKSKKYANNFYRLYASGANAITEYQVRQENKKLSKRKKDNRRLGR